MAYGKDKNSWEQPANKDSPALYTMPQQITFMNENRQRRAQNRATNSRDYPDIDSRNTYRSNDNIDWSRASFKIKKPKPGKIRQMSKEELFGIGISFLLSVCFAVIIAMAMVYLTPIVMKNFSNFLYDVREVGTIAKEKLFMNKGEGNTIDLLRDVSEGMFKSSCYKSFPCRFNTGKIMDVATIFSAIVSQSQRSVSIVNNVMKKEIGSIDLSQFSAESLNLQWNSSLSAVLANVDIEESDILNASPFRELFNNPPTFEINKNTGDSSRSSTLDARRGFLSLLLNGKKRWVAMKYDDIPKSGYNSAWVVSQAFDNSGDKVYFIIQNEGEYVYIPEGWIFGYEVISTDDRNISIHVKYEARDYDSSSYFQFYANGKERLTQGDISGAIRYFKLGLALNRNILLLEGIGDAMTLNMQFLAAEEFYREVLSLNPQSVAVYSKLIKLLINHANQDVSDSIAELLSQADRAGVRSYVLTSVQELI